MSTFFSETYTVVPRYNDHLYNINFDFRRNIFGNRSFVIKSYYILTEFTLADTDGDSPQQIAFFTHFYSLKRQKKSSDKLFPDKNVQPDVNRYFEQRCNKTCRRTGQLAWDALFLYEAF